MKKILILLLGLFAAQISPSEERTQPQQMTIWLGPYQEHSINLSILDLAAHELKIVAAYPGMTPQSVCSIELKDSLGQSQNIKKFLRSVDILSILDHRSQNDLIVTGGSVFFDLATPDQPYVGGIVIASKSLQTLQDIIFKSFGQRFSQLYVITHICKEKTTTGETQ